MLIEVPADFETRVMEEIAKKDQEGRLKVEERNVRWEPKREELT